MTVTAVSGSGQRYVRQIMAAQGNAGNIHAKKRLSCKRLPFALQKVTFYKLKGNLLQAERRPFADYLIISGLQEVFSCSCPDVSLHAGECP